MLEMLYDADVWRLPPSSPLSPDAGPRELPPTKPARFPVLISHPCALPNVSHSDDRAAMGVILCGQTLQRSQPGLRPVTGVQEPWRGSGLPCSPLCPRSFGLEQTRPFHLKGSVPAFLATWVMASSAQEGGRLSWVQPRRGGIWTQQLPLSVRSLTRNKSISAK